MFHGKKVLIKSNLISRRNKPYFVPKISGICPVFTANYTIFNKNKVCKMNFNVIDVSRD